MRQMTVRQLEYVVAVADERNFTRAAARCQVVQSALSHQVTRLERDHGITLFHRGARGARLTPAGEVFIGHARRVLAELDLAVAGVAGSAGALSGTLRVGVIGATGAAGARLERALASFHREHPGVEIVIRDSGSVRMTEEVRGGELDLAFVGLFAEQVGDGLACHELRSEPLVAVVASDHVLAGQMRVSLRDLAAAGRSIELRPASGRRVQVDAAYVRAAAERRVAFELGALEDIVRFARLGLGYAIVPRSTVRREGDVAVMGLDDPLAVHPVTLVHLAPSGMAPSARAFLAMLLP
jgi:DNA-binding transcriptional LysR family regulator